MIKLVELTYIFCILLILSYSGSSASEYPSCEVIKEGPIQFESLTPSDTIKIKISGKPCYQAKLSISIFSPEGKELYKYEAPFKQHVATHWEDPQLCEDAINFANKALESAHWGKSSSLPEWKSEYEFYDENSTSIAVDKEKYKYYRELNIPVLWHQTYYEGWRHIVYDKKKKVSVVLLDGNL